jgi:hypothetical protein
MVTLFFIERGDKEMISTPSTQINTAVDPPHPVAAAAAFQPS